MFSRRRLKFAILIVVLGLLATILFFVSAPSSPEFDAQLWKADQSARWGMISDLQRGPNLRVGTRSQDVAEILGKPDQIDQAAKFGDEISKEVAFVWSYAVGSHSGMRVDADFFGVAFNKEGQVVQTWIWQS